MSEYTFSVGDRVQLIDDDLIGEIKSLLSKDDDGEIVEFATVLWDDSDEAEECRLDELEPEGEQDEIEPESELEAAFQKACDEHMKEIDEQLELASDALDKAVELSEKYGIPFSAGTSPLGQSYVPNSFEKKFPGLESSFAEEITGAYSEYYGEGGGWEHSAVC